VCFSPGKHSKMNGRVL